MSVAIAEYRRLQVNLSHVEGGALTSYTGFIYRSGSDKQLIFEPPLHCTMFTIEDLTSILEAMRKAQEDPSF